MKRIAVNNDSNSNININNNNNSDIIDHKADPIGFMEQKRKVIITNNRNNVNSIEIHLIYQIKIWQKKV